MVDGNTLLLTCRECGVSFTRVRQPGQKPKYCRSCAAEVIRRSARERARLKAAARRLPPRMDGTCSDCLQPFSRHLPRGAFPSRCPTCTAERLRESARVRAARRRARVSAETRYVPCQACGAALERQFGARQRSWCLPCYREHRRNIYHRKRSLVDPFRIVCADCGKSVPSRFRDRRKRCDRCAAIRRGSLTKQWLAINPDRKRDYIRRKNGQNRAKRFNVARESFNNRDIFNRDRWICGICRRKISRKLRWPHPKSVSLDHIIPMSEGGPHTRANCRAAHVKCNLRRSNRGGGEQLALIG
jgi:hypothetical protein